MTRIALRSSTGGAGVNQAETKIQAGPRTMDPLDNLCNVRLQVFDGFVFRFYDDPGPLIGVSNLLSDSFMLHLVDMMIQHSAFSALRIFVRSHIIARERYLLDLQHSQDILYTIIARPRPRPRARERRWDRGRGDRRELERMRSYTQSAVGVDGSLNAGFTGRLPKNRDRCRRNAIAVSAWLPQASRSAAQRCHLTSLVRFAVD